jgi:hypothetical protein
VNLQAYQIFLDVLLQVTLIANREKAKEEQLRLLNIGTLG